MEYLLFGGLLLAALVWLLAPWLKRRLEHRGRPAVPEPDPASAADETLPATQPDDAAATRPGRSPDEIDTQPGGPDTELMQRPSASTEAEDLELTEEEADALLKRLQEAAMLDAQERAAEEKARKAELDRVADLKARHEAQSRALRDEAIQRAKLAAQEKAKAAAAALRQRKADELAVTRARELEELGRQQQQRRIAEEEEQERARQARRDEQARREEAQQRLLQQQQHEREQAELQARLQAEQSATQAAARQALQAQALQQEQLLRQAQEAARGEEEARAAALEQAERQAREEAGDAQAAHRPEAAAAARTPRLPEHTLVMVADDSKVVRVKASRLLAKHQYQVLLAEDGSDAARQILERAPDLLITDVEMPGMDGFELTRHVRQDPRTAHIPVIMITAADDRHRDAAQDAGVNVLLGKPYEDADLIARIESTLNPG